MEGVPCFQIRFLLCSYVIQYNLHLLQGAEDLNMF